MQNQARQGKILYKEFYKTVFITYGEKLLKCSNPKQLKMQPTTVQECMYVCMSVCEHAHVCAHTLSSWYYSGLPLNQHKKD